MERARRLLEPVIYRTPLAESAFLNDLSGQRLQFKLENLQRTGSFKIRGAYAHLAGLAPEAAARGVVTASAGNHAQGVALAASLLGISALVVMPERASLTKVEATRGYGAEIKLYGESFDDANLLAQSLAESTGRVYIPAFNSLEVIAGQATVGLEMLAQCPEINTLVVPVGGGGLIAGVAAVAEKMRGQTIRVVGVEAKAQDAVVRSLAQGEVVEVPRRHTIADGIQVKRPGDVTLALIQKYVDEVVTVSERDISRAMLLFLERMKIVVEGAGAVGLAAILSGALRPKAASPIGVVVSGGNLDVSLLSRILQKGLVEEGRQLHLFTILSDAPGELSHLLAEVARLGANVVRVEHERWHPSLDVEQVGIGLVLETRDAVHQRAVVQTLSALGYSIQAPRSFRTKNFDN